MLKLIYVLQNHTEHTVMKKYINEGMWMQIARYIYIYLYRSELNPDLCAWTHIVFPGERSSWEGEQGFRGDIGEHIDVKRGMEDAGPGGGDWSWREGGAWRMSRDPRGKGEEKRQMGI